MRELDVDKLWLIDYKSLKKFGKIISIFFIFAIKKN